MKVLYLYTEIMGYNLPILEQLVNRYGATVDVIHWNQNKLTPFVANTKLEDIRFHERSSFTAKTLAQFAVSIQPDLVYVSGWQDKGYLPALKKLKAQGAKIVMGLDSQWTGSLRQQLGAKLLRWWYRPRYFSYAWVPGPIQFAYANRIGFAKDEIIFNLLTANTDLFAKAATSLQYGKLNSYPKQFLYVGRFTSSKGIDTLLSAFEYYKNQLKGDWDLTCIGNGPLESLLHAHPDIKVSAFMPQSELAKHAEMSGAFVLPSRYEPWGVVVHEFATAGLPLILSNQVGARAQFLVDNLNGVTFAEGDAKALAEKMYAISSKSARQLVAMGRASAQLAGAINPVIATASFVSVVKTDVQSVDVSC